MRYHSFYRVGLHNYIYAGDRQKTGTRFRIPAYMINMCIRADDDMHSCADWSRSLVRSFAVGSLRVEYSGYLD